MASPLRVPSGYNAPPWRSGAKPAGSSLALVKDLTDLGQALYIEQQVEKALHIEDVAVPGELKS